MCIYVEKLIAVHGTLGYPVRDTICPTLSNASLSMHRQQNCTSGIHRHPPKTEKGTRLLPDRIDFKLHCCFSREKWNSFQNFRSNFKSYHLTVKPDVYNLAARKVWKFKAELLAEWKAPVVWFFPKRKLNYEHEVSYKNVYRFLLKEIAFLRNFFFLFLYSFSI